jgi:hypothetical protein
VTRINIKNNIFKTCTEQAIRLGNGISYLNIDHNLYDVTKVAVYGSSSYTTLAQWQAATQCDDNSIATDPLFADIITYNIQSTSPVINEGVDVGLKADFNGNFIIGLPDIGAYEFISGENRPPSIMNQSFEIAKNSPYGTLAGTIAASDPDVGQTLVYSIVSGNTNGTFTLNAYTGVLFVANGAFLNDDFVLVVKVTDDWNISSQATITINVIPTGIESTGNNSTIKVYPNPVSDEFIIETEENFDRQGFEIFNSTGHIIFSGNLSERTAVPTTTFSHGVYLIKVKNGSLFEFRRIVKL